MSSISSKTPQKSRKEKEKERDRERDKERKLSQQEPNNERLKTVVRRLPPNLPEEIFWQSVQSWVTEDTAVWKTYYPGKIRKRYTWSFENLNKLIIISSSVRTRRTSHPVHILHSRRKNNSNCSVASMMATFLGIRQVRYCAVLDGQLLICYRR